MVEWGLQYAGMELIPARRSDLVLEGEGDATAVLDPVLGRRVRLGAVGGGILRALDVPLGLDALASAVGLPPGQVEAALRGLAGLRLLDSEGARAIVADAAAVAAMAKADPATVPLLFRDDARFGCTMCGSCCGGHNIGPVMDDVMVQIESHRDRFMAEADAPEGLFFSVPGAAGEEHTFCRNRDGWCVFLDDDRRCMIHREIGGEKKPRICRLFPFQFTATPEGVAVSLQMECRGFVDARKGPKLADQEAEIRRLLALAPSVQRVPPEVKLRGRQGCTYAEYLELENQLHAAVDAHADAPTEALMAMARVLRDALPGAPAPAVPAAALSSTLDALISGMADALDAMHRGIVSRSPGVVVHTDSLPELVRALGWLKSDLPRLFRAPARRDQRALFAEKAHHALMGKDLLQAPDLISGFAHLVFQWLWSCALAGERARLAKRRHWVAQDYMDALTVVGFAWRTEEVGDLVTQNAKSLAHLFFDQLEPLVASAAVVASPDRRQHLFKF